jgi:hypothetical protein
MEMFDCDWGDKGPKAGKCWECWKCEPCCGDPCEAGAGIKCGKLIYLFYTLSLNFKQDPELFGNSQQPLIIIYYPSNMEFIFILVENYFTKLN